MSIDALRTASRSRGARFGVQAAEWVFTLVAAVAVLGAVALITAPRLLGWDGVIVLSGSMEPELPVGGLAFVDPDVKAEDVSQGDVISFRSATGARVTHRVVEVVEEPGGLSFRTKGDANEDADPQLVPSRDLMGQVRFDLPYVGYAAERLRERTWFYIVLGVPAALLIAGELMSVARELRRKEAAR